MSRLWRSLALLLLLVPAAVMADAPIQGGWGDTLMANPEERVTQLVLDLRTQAEAMAGVTFEKWEPLTYTTQVATRE